MNNNFQSISKLLSTASILVPQSRSSVGTYTPENFELEYETIQSPDNTSEVLQAYSTGRSLSYQHATLTKTVVWGKSLTLINQINLVRKSMKAIVLTFTKETGRAGSEEYLYHNIQEVKVAIVGNSNIVYRQGINKNRFYSEVKRVFKKMEDYDRFMSIQSFYKDLFALVIDLRSIEDNMKHATGKKIVNTQSVFLLEIRKLATTVDVMCKTRCP